MSDEIMEFDKSVEGEVDLARMKEELAQVQEQLAQAEYERQLAVELTRAGVVDLDAAFKLAGEGNDAQVVVEQLKQDKPYLFVGPGKAVAGPTAGVKPVRKESGQVQLANALRQARQSGSRRDMYEYLRLRRALKK